MGHSDLDPAIHDRSPWNAGKKVGPKRPLKPRDIWAIRFYPDEHKRLRDRAPFDLAVDSKLRGCDLVKIRIGDLMSAGSFRDRATVIQQKTDRPVQFEIMTEARKSLKTWLNRRGGTIRDFVFPSRIDYPGHLSTRQYARLVDEWVSTISAACSDPMKDRSVGRSGTAARRKVNRDCGRFSPQVRESASRSKSLPFSQTERATETCRSLVLRRDVMPLAAPRAGWPTGLVRRRYR